MSRLLIVDDEQSICWGLRRLGESIGHDVVTVSSAERALETVERVRPDAILLDVRLPGMDGLAAIEGLRERIGQVPIIVMTAYGDLKTAVEAVRAGAFEYLIKPFDLEQVERALTRALKHAEEPGVVAPQRRHVGGLIGSSSAMQNVFKQIALAAASECGVLLLGESGTGKELAARAIHQYSARTEGPFVAVNVASLSSALAESELFGHCRGAFTGADQERIGLLAQADGGTLFLDEVADIPLPVQVKLLRSLEHGEVTPVGSGQAVRTNFRIVSATHQDLLKKVKEGTFRHDLYFRLGAFRIDIPPLRNRREDIGELAEHFLGALGPPTTGVPVISESTLRELERRPWFGNVRELRNAMEHALIVARSGTIEPEHLPPPAEAVWLDVAESAPSLESQLATVIERWAGVRLDGDAEQGQVYEQLLRLIEPPLFQAALARHQGQCAAAARRLGIHRTTLRKKLDQYGIPPE